MPHVSGFYRRKGTLGGLELRRHSLDSKSYTNTPSMNFSKNTAPTNQFIPTDENLTYLTPRDDGNQNRGSVLKRSQCCNSAPPTQQEKIKPKRFRMIKLRYASESQLSTKARLHAQFKSAPSIRQNTELVNTGSTSDPRSGACAKKKSRETRLPRRSHTSVTSRREQRSNNENTEILAPGTRDQALHAPPYRDSNSCILLDETQSASQAVLPPYGQSGTSTLSLSLNRLSDSSRSDVSSGEHGVYASTTTTTHTIHTTTTFFRLPRRKKQTPLFDLSHLPKKSDSIDSTPVSALNQTSGESSRKSATEYLSVSIVNSSIALDALNEGRTVSPPLSLDHRKSDQLVRQGSRASNKTSSSRTKLGVRERSSTLSSLQQTPLDDLTSTPTIQSTRTSSSIGRKSLGEFFGLSYKNQQNSEVALPRHSSGLATLCLNSPKNGSTSIPKEIPCILPERHEDDTPAKYLIRLEEAVSRGAVASILSKGADLFSQAVLRSYMRGFSFFGDPMDMAIRKLLMEVELPKETQQIDRCLQAFANRYHECNPGIYASPDQAYFIAFSLLILHTDVFNKNNKHKMQKSEYLKNTRGEGIFDEILECFYDNISYTPFIHVEDDRGVNSERIIQHKTKKKSVFSTNIDYTKRQSKEPVDLYTLIICKNLDSLRPNLKDVLYLEENYNYLGTAASLNISDLQRTFFRTGVLQIVSARSRPDAFMSDKTVNNPNEAQVGIVDIKITKVGILWRKDPGKKKTRSPWQEWGAILTGAQLYFFKNTTWIKSLMNQLETHIKQGNHDTPVIFKPPLDQFKHDEMMSTDDSVALQDSLYKKHKNAFVFVRHAGFEETFLADSEEEMNDWLAKLNYAATFRTSRVRMRGVVGGNYDGQRSRDLHSLDDLKESVQSFQASSGEVTIVNGKADTKMADEILSARREIMLQKISDGEEKLNAAQKHLETQLRNARHLGILAPIQQKTRESILIAAARIAAQLKWGRISIWRLRCHRDILCMDLEEEI